MRPVVASGTAGRILLLTALYFAQGLPFGIFTQALPVMMRQQGHSLEAIGLSNLLALPWVLKFMWAPAVDHIRGPRRNVIVPLNLAAAALLVALGLTEPGAIGPLVAVVFSCNLLAATQDVATDGLAVETLRDDERGLGNGVQVAGYRLGMVFGGGVLVQLFGSWGWFSTFATAAAALVVVTAPLFWVPPAPRVPPADPEIGAQVLRWDRWFAGRDGFVWFVLLLTYKLGDAFGTAMVKPMLVDQGLDLEQIGALLGLRGSVAGMIGALIGGAVASRVPRRTALVGFGLLQVPALATWWGVARLGPAYAPSAVIVEHLVSGMATAALFTAMMDMCRPGRAGTDYTVQASVVVLAQGVFAVASGWSAARLGFEGHLLVATALCLVPVVWLARVRSGSARFRLA